MTQVLMRKIELKPDMGIPTIQDSSYKNLLISVFETPKNPGAPTNMKEIRQVQPVLEMLEAAKTSESVLFTESQWKEAVSRIANHPWAKNFVKVIQFEDDIINAPEVPMAEEESDE